MAELEVAGIKFRGGRRFVVLTIISSLVGVLWGGFTYYQKFLDMEKKIDGYIAPDLSGFDKRLDLIQQETEMITQEMSMII